MRQHHCGWLVLLVTLVSPGLSQAATYGRLPLGFEENRGQTSAQVNYLARGQGYGLFLSPTSATLRLATHRHSAELRMDFVGAGAPQLQGIDPLPGTSRYYRGSDPGQWTAEVRSFARVQYRDVYPGISLVFYGKEQYLEYDFLVAPKANPRAIRLAFAGADSLRLDRSGDLVLHTGGGEVRMLKPVAYQDIAGARRPVDASYAVQGKHVSFLVGAYDPTHPLVIDPVLSYASYLGGSGMDGASAIAVDATGNAYLAGWTSSADFPTTAGAPRTTAGGLTDAFVVKIDPTGTSRLYSTFLGGSSDDYGKGIALDQNGNIYVAGSTQSSDFPSLNPLQGFGGATDAFVAKLSPSGALLYSTYLGGSGNDDARAIAVSPSDNSVFVAGVTDSANFPVTSGALRTTLGGASDAFVVKLNASGNAKVYATYLGGTNSDEATGIAVNGFGDAWVTGATWSSDFPTSAALQAYGGSLDAFVCRLDPAGTGLLFSTFLGGTSVDRAAAIALDSNGNPYVTGDTGSTNFPTTNGAFQTASNGLFPDEDAFVVKYTSSGSQVAYATRLGGTGDDAGYGITVDATGNAIVTGQTTSANFPVASNVRDFAGGVDAFVSVVNTLGSALTFSSCLGGANNDSGRGIAADPNGRSYVAGMTNSTNFPVRPQIGGLQPVPGGGFQDGFAAAVQYCDYVASLTGSPFTLAGGNGSVLITGNSGCPWSAATNEAWITFPTGSTGAGNGTVSYSVAANGGTAPRSGTISIGHQTLDVSQNGRPVLSIAKTHSGNFSQGQANATFTLTVSNQAGAGPTVGTVTVTETVPNGMTLISMAGSGWTCPNGGPSCTRSDVLAAGASYEPITVTVNVAANAVFPLINAVGVSGGSSASANATDTVNTSCVQPFPIAAYSSAAVTVSVTLTATVGCAWTVNNTNSWVHPISLPNGTGSAVLSFFVDANPLPFQRFSAISIGGQTLTILQGGNVTPSGSGLRFVAVTPCRIADTRNAAGAFGGPNLTGGVSRDFDIRASVCNIPANALAYSLNLTVVPLAPLGFLSVWPAGQSQPMVSTLNSSDGRVKANAAIVPAGTNGAITLYATDATHAIIDINGYFVPVNGSNNLAFYPITPCRLADTRNAAGPFGAPSLAASVARSFPLLSGGCGIPASAQAYALNMTVVPLAPLGFLATWPSGQSQPGSSTLNAPTGTVVANAAIVPAGTGGAITVLASNPTELIIDINGYFAPPGAGGMQFYAATPCRILDTRDAASPFGGPLLAAAMQRTFVVAASACGIPAVAGAYSLNATVVPPAPVGFLSLWGAGGQPSVSTLNASDGSVVANAALVPAASTGSVNAYASHATHLILDINGYFAQ